MTTAIEYQTLMFGLVDKIKTDLIAVVAPASKVETRYIVSEGRNDEQWLGVLRDDEGNVDRWLITISGITGLNESNQEANSVNTFAKPIQITIDYFADYHHGQDVVGAVGAETTTNTEREFLKKIIALDLLLEKKRRCLQTNTEIKDWDLVLKLRRFEQATTHWMSGKLNVEFTDIFLN